ncbi:ferrochelatase [Helicobacter cetorum]|uniref:Ferrochelatase n=1 Tax=Helicobacter cetorum (strain ATCC BAA-429 / MIT 00-7128) TaxID=182217 RepID=I0EMS2_HELC0|nr:ferrochelatase [Helicobacter cetorum]AFI04241.1 ferrochelatase [Helicobacter cetorum MIT 00-7128]
MSLSNENNYNLNSSAMKSPKEAVILLNMGGPNSLYEVEVFLKNMFDDPCILTIKNNFMRKMVGKMIVNARVEKSKKIYEKLGGKSPLTPITFALTKRLNELDSSRFYTYAMRYTPPYAPMVLQDLVSKEIDSLVLFSMYPQYSSTTTLSSFNDAFKALKSIEGFRPKVRVIERFYTAPKLNEIILDTILATLKGQKSEDFTLIFSVHGLPQSIIDAGDTYQKECEHHVSLLKELMQQKNINFKKVLLSYQSKLGPMKWLEPSTESLIEEHRKSNIIIYPLAFTIDNSETLYELEIQYRLMAKRLGIKEYLVCPCLNDSLEFAKLIVELVQESSSQILQKNDCIV